MRTFNDETRAAIARAWTESQLTQEEYAARFGISTRTLRLWLARYASTRPPLAEARAILVDAIERLQALMATVDAQAACQSERGAASSAEGPACRPAVVREPVDAKDATARATSSSPVPRTRPGTARHADLDTLVAGVRAELAKATNEPSAPNTGTAPAPPPERRVRASGYFAITDCE